METPSKVPEQVKTPSYDRTVQAWMRAYLETVSLRKKLEAEEKKMKEAEALFPEIRNIAGLARKKRLVTGDPGGERDKPSSSQGGAGPKKRKLDELPQTKERTLVKGRLHSLIQRARSGKRRIQKVELRQLFRELRSEKIAPSKEEQALLAESGSIDQDELTRWYLEGVPAEPNPDLEREAVRLALFPEEGMDSDI